MRSMFLCLATVTALPAWAQGTLTGHVRDPSGLGVASAEVHLADGPSGTVTDARGAFRMQGVPAGRVQVSARRIGFLPGSSDTTVGDGQTVDVTVVLDFTPRQLEPVMVTVLRDPFDARLAGFRLRSQKHVGTFITRERIESSYSSSFSDILRSVPGVRVQSVNSGFQNSVRFRGADCAPVVFIDGFPATAGEFDVDVIDPASVEGVEVYMDNLTVPPEFVAPRALAHCGIIAVWLRPFRPTPRKPKAVSQALLRKMMESSAVYAANEVDIPARIDRETFSPVYPDSLWKAGASGQAMVEMVVDTLGHVEMDFFSVVSASHPEFGESVRLALPRARFAPAMKGRRRVRQIVQLPTHFNRPKP